MELLSPAEVGDRADLDEEAAQRSPDCGACWIRLRHQLSIDAVEGGPEIRIREIRCHGNHVAQLRSRRGEDGLEVADDLASLLDDVRADGGAGSRIARHLTGYK